MLSLAQNKCVGFDVCGRDEAKTSVTYGFACCRLLFHVLSISFFAIFRNRKVMRGAKRPKWEQAERTGNTREHQKNDLDRLRSVPAVRIRCRAVSLESRKLL